MIFIIIILTRLQLLAIPFHARAASSYLLRMNTLNIWGILGPGRGNLVLEQDPRRPRVRKPQRVRDATELPMASKYEDQSTCPIQSFRSGLTCRPPSIEVKISAAYHRYLRAKFFPPRLQRLVALAKVGEQHGGIITYMMGWVARTSRNEMPAVAGPTELGKVSGLRFLRPACS